MTPERYAALLAGTDQLTSSEIQIGWHFCCDFDGLLIGPDMPEAENCDLFAKDIFHLPNLFDATQPYAAD